MKKRLISALLALALILSNFTGGGLIEHVHVEAADVDIPDTFEPFDLYLHFNDFKNSIKVDKYGTFTLSVDNTGDGSLTKDFSWITLSSSANAADENGKSSLAMGTVIKTTSFKLDDQEYSLDSNETSVQAGSFVKFDYYKNVWGVTNHINNKPDTAQKVEITIEIIKPDHHVDFSKSDIYLHAGIMGGSNLSSKVTIDHYGDYKISCEGSELVNYSWISLKNSKDVTHEGESSGIPPATEFVATKLFIDDTEYKFKDSDTHIGRASSDGKVNINYYFSISGEDYIVDRPANASKIELYFTVREPVIEENIPHIDTPEGYELVTSDSTGVFEFGKEGYGETDILFLNNKGSNEAEPVLKEDDLIVFAFNASDFSDHAQRKAKIAGQAIDWRMSGSISGNASETVYKEVRTTLKEFLATADSNTVNYSNLRRLVLQVDGVKRGVKVAGAAYAVFRKSEAEPEPDIPSCNKKHDESWVVIDNPEAVEASGAQFKIKFASDDKAYNGDTVEIHVLGTADVEGKSKPGIRLYVASGSGYNNNNLTGSTNCMTGIENGSFEFDTTINVGVGANTDLAKDVPGDCIVFNTTPSWVSNYDGYNSAVITHFAYKITHNHTTEQNKTAYDGKYHWTACDVCGQPITGEKSAHTYNSNPLKCDDCDFTHLENEVEVDISKDIVVDTGNALRVEDGAIIIENGANDEQYGIKMPATLKAGKEYTFHIVFESDGNVRFRPSPNGTDGGGNSWNEVYNTVGFHDAMDIKFTPNEDDGYLEIKATYGQKLEYAKITHIGVVYPVHVHKYEYAHDLTTHWGQCTVCGMVQDPEPHDEACATPGTACSKCGFVHPLGEQAIDIKDQTKFKAENGELTFADGSLTLSGGYIKVTLPRKLVKDDTIILHLVGNSSDPKVRYWIPIDGDQGSAADEYNGTVGTDDSTAIAVNGAFDITFPERTLTADASDVLTIKYNYNGTNITLTHIGIVIPECPHNTQEKYYEWKHNEKEHWQECKLCGDKKPAEPHNSDAADGSCDKCGFKEKHPEGEEKAAITQESITVNGDKVTVADGVITVTECNDFIIKLPKAIPVGDTVTVHIIGTLNSNIGLRFRLLEDNNTNSVVRTDWFSPNASGYFTFTQEYTLKSTDGSNKGTPIAGNYIEVKAIAGAQENFDLSITHIAIVYGKHNFKDEWTYDNTHHWHDCSDEGCEVKSDYGVHTYSEEKPGVCASCNRPHGDNEHNYENGKCTVCYYVHEAHTPVPGSYKSAGNDNHTYTCSVCKATVTEAHEKGELVKTDPNKHWTSCNKCDAHIDEAAHSLEYGKDDSQHWQSCKTCGYESSHVNHVWVEGKPSKEPSHTEEGLRTDSCECGATKDVTLPADKDAHTWGDWTVGTAPTLEDGGTVKRSCTENDGGEEQKSVPALSDTSEWDVEHTEAADCTKTGLDTYTSKTYGVKVTVEIEKTPHSFTTKYGSDDTQHWLICDNCGEIGEKTDHSAGAGAKYTDNADGDTHSYTCSVCGEKVNEKHTVTKKYDTDNHWDYCDKCKYEGETKPHTGYATKDSISHSVDCPDCDYQNSSEAHTPGSDWIYDEEANARYHICDKCGDKCDLAYHSYVYKDDGNGTTHHQECSTCHHVKANSTVAHNYQNGVCKDCNYTHPEEAHVWGEGWKPDTGGTTHSRKCTVCGKTETKPHGYPENWTPVEGGKQHSKTCEACGKTVSEDHSYGGWTNVNETTHKHSCECGYEETATHNFGTGFDSYRTDSINHWQVCSDCQGQSAKVNHSYPEGEDHCSVCNYWNHQHKMVWMDDGQNHWQECSDPDCNHKTDKEPHGSSEYTYNSTQHVKTCPTCKATIAEDHILVYDKNELGHWQKCTVCEYESHSSAHNYTDVSDASEHWKICDTCKYETEHAAHTPKSELGRNETQHWSICSECGKDYNYSEHTPSSDLRHDAEGHWNYCTECGYENTASKSNHNWDNGIVVKPATETDEGLKKFTCTECDETKTESIPKLSHTHIPGEEWKHDETSHWHECVSETCDDRNAKLEEAAHIEDGGIVTKEATELEEGTMTYKCTVCGRVLRTEAIEKLAHTHVPGEEWKHDETSHWHECVSEVCDAPDVQLEKAEHQWDDGVVTSEPTYTKEGEKLFTCGVCKATKVEKIPVNSHEHETVMKSDANGHWNECTICGETVGEVEAHTPGDWITDSEATSTLPGKRHKQCTVCGYVTDTLEIPATGDIDVEVPTVGNVPKVEIPSEQQEALKNAVITEEDVDAIETGATIDIDLTVENADSSIDSDTKAKVDSKTEEGGYKHISYLEISLTKTTTDVQGREKQEEINELGREIRIVIAVPSQYIRNSRSFAVIRVHDGVVDVLNDLDSDPNTVTISTGLFSSYTLVYADSQPSPGTPGGLIGHAHIITDIRHDSEYHWRGCFLCSMRVDVARHNFVNGVCPICGYRDPNYVPGEDDEAPVEVSDDIVNVVAPAQEAEQGGDPEETPEVTDTPADLPATEMEVVEVKEDDETSENPKTGVIFTGIGAVMAAIAALIAKRK